MRTFEVTVAIMACVVTMLSVGSVNGFGGGMKIITAYGTYIPGKSKKKS